MMKKILIGIIFISLYSYAGVIHGISKEIKSDSVVFKVGGCFISSKAKISFKESEGNEISAYKTLFSNSKNSLIFEKLYLDGDYEFMATTEYLLSKAFSMTILDDVHSRYYALFEGKSNNGNMVRIIITQPINNSIEILYGFNKDEFENVKSCVLNNGDNGPNKSIEVIGSFIDKPASNWSMSLTVGGDIIERVSNKL